MMKPHEVEKDIGGSQIEVYEMPSIPGGGRPTVLTTVVVRKLGIGRERGML